MKNFCLGGIIAMYVSGVFGFGYLSIQDTDHKRAENVLRESLEKKKAQEIRAWQDAVLMQQNPIIPKHKKKK